MIFRIFAILAFPTFVWADDACDDLWFTRNQIFADAGYCFGSNLGKSVFGTDECTTKNVLLPLREKDQVSRIRDEERRWECRVDTTKTALSIHSFALRQLLTEQPLRDFTESSCIEYRGPRFALYDGPTPGSTIIGFVNPGDTISNSHIPFDDDRIDSWHYVSQVWVGDLEKPDIGWTKINYWRQCGMVAG